MFNVALDATAVLVAQRLNDLVKDLRESVLLLFLLIWIKNPQLLNLQAVRPVFKRSTIASYHVIIRLNS